MKNERVLNGSAKTAIDFSELENAINELGEISSRFNQKEQPRGSQAILKFPLPEEKQSFYLAANGENFYFVLWDLSQKIRGYLKYGHDFKTSDEAIESIRTDLFDLMDDYGVDFAHVS